MYLLLAFIAVPLIEIALFIQIGGFIGLWSTLAIVILTALLGAALVRNQGRAVMTRLSGAFADLHDPSEPLAEGAMILFAGALLLTPGFFTDAVGFALLSPSVRRWIFARLSGRITMQGFAAHQMSPDAQARPGQPDIIDAEYEELSPGPRRGSSGWSKDPSSGH